MSRYQPGFIRKSDFRRKPIPPTLVGGVFNISSPVIYIALQQKRNIYSIIITIFIVSAVMTNCFNRSRPIIKRDVAAFHNFDREKSYFINRKKLYNDYNEAVNKLYNFKKIGIIIGSDSWEYPLWIMLKRRNWQGSIVHIVDKKTIESVDAIMMLDIDNMFGIKRPESKNPYVYIP